jgi:tRNA threonylcarbamoyladenosine biosynthesis protein TsaE
MCGNRTIFIQNLDELAVLANFISKNITSGDFIALTGTLGTGKTTFTRMVCENLGITGKITSPTFTLVNEYEVNHLTLLHGDFYRLTDREIENSLLELEERLEASGLAAIFEWAERAPQLQYRWTWHLDFTFSPQDESQRVITLETSTPEKLDQIPEGLDHAL